MSRMSEEKTITIILLSGNFQFIAGPHSYDDTLTGRTGFAAGEQVFYSCIVRNNGDVIANAQIDKHDLDTGEHLGYFLIPDPVPPGEDYDILVRLGAVVLIGTMPNRNWNVKFTVTP